MQRKSYLFVVCFLMLILIIPVVSIASTPIATLEQISPTPTTYALVSDFNPFNYTGVGDVTAPLYDVPGIGTAADFAGFPVGDIALIQRGTLTFQEKVQNAANAGATGALIYDINFANDAGFGTLQSLALIPALFVTRDVGLNLLNETGPVDIHMAVYTSFPDTIAVPEPSTILLLGAGLAGVGLMRRRFKK